MWANCSTDSLEVIREPGIPELQEQSIEDSLYALRHSCAALLLQANVHPKIVADRLGHSSVTLTMDVYSHVLPTMQTEATAQLERMLYG